MKIEWRSIIFGAITLIVLEMFAQLALVLIAAYYGNVGSSMTLISEYKALIWFAFGLLTHAGIMFWGGWLTAQTCEDHQVFHAAAAAVIATIISTYWTLSVAVGNPTLAILWFVGVSIVAAGSAGYLKHKIILTKMSSAQT